MTNKANGCAGWAVAGVLGVIAVGQCMGEDPVPSQASDPLALATPSPAPVMRETARQFLYVRAETLNCRASPSTSSETVRRLADRDLVGVVREENGWAKLSDPACWVRRDYLGSSPRERPVAQPQPLYASGSRRSASSSAYYRNCSEARAAGAAPVYAGDPGYARRLDRDGDGVGCE
ncbi:MAG: excalibur calcium-binding domain-containing protein [Caulobacteraceae bacterium]|nr:excalibur calcium-binding domain-containing protein [Caulobacteraceae bacterium]